jgi:dynein heavy chain 1
MGPLNGSPAPAPPGALVPAHNPAVVAEYLIEVLAVTLGAKKADLEGPGSLLHPARHNETLQKLSRFATEPLVALYASKDSVETEQPISDAACVLPLGQNVCHRF